MGSRFDNGYYGISVNQVKFHVAIENTLPAVHELRLQSAEDQGARIRCQSVQEASVLVPVGSVWKYLDDDSDQGTTWREASV